MSSKLFVYCHFKFVWWISLSSLCWCNMSVSTQFILMIHNIFPYVTRWEHLATMFNEATRNVNVPEQLSNIQVSITAWAYLGRGMSSFYFFFYIFHHSKFCKVIEVSPQNLKIYRCFPKICLVTPKFES